MSVPTSRLGQGNLSSPDLSQDQLISVDSINPQLNSLLNQMSNEGHFKRPLDDSDLDINLDSTIKSNISASTSTSKLDHNENSSLQPTEIPALCIFSHLRYCMQSKNIPWLVQWEVACFLSENRHKESTITMDNLDKFQIYLSEDFSTFISKDPETLGLKVLLQAIPEYIKYSNTKTLGPFQQEIAVKSPWNEMKTEEAINISNITTPSKHYNEKVVFRLKLDSNFKYHLETPELGSAHPFSWYFGSSSILCTQIPNTLLEQGQWKKLVSFLHKPVIIYEWVFRAFYAKDQNVYFIQTNEIYNGTSLLPGKGGMGLIQFLNWYNPLDLNNKQTMAKWASRFSLGLSTSCHGFLHVTVFTLFLPFNYLIFF